MPTTIPTSRWARILTRCGVRAITAMAWAPAFHDHVHLAAFPEGRDELAAFVAQVLSASELLELVEEGLSLSARRLMAALPERFATLADCIEFAHEPQALAEHVYLGRLGNTAPGDGWRYRGRGVPLIAGRAHYATVFEALGEAPDARPERLSSPDIAVRLALLWWAQKIPERALGNALSLTQAVHRAALDLFDRDALAAKAAAALDDVLPQANA